MYKFSLKNGILYSSLYFVISFIFYFVALYVALSVLEGDTSSVDNLVLFIGSALVFPFLYLLGPILQSFLPKNISLIISLIFNSIFWGVLIEFVVYIINRRRA